MRNSIIDIINLLGELLKSRDDIKAGVERFFSELLSTQPSYFEGIDVAQLQELLDFRCLDTEKNQLEKEVTMEEIENVLFAMPNNKCPGPDGYSVFLRRFHRSYSDF